MNDQSLPWGVWADQLEEEGRDVAQLRWWLLWGFFLADGYSDMDYEEGPLDSGDGETGVPSRGIAFGCGGGPGDGAGNGIAFDYGGDDGEGQGPLTSRGDRMTGCVVGD